MDRRLMWKWRLVCFLVRLISRTRAKRVERLKKLRDYIHRELSGLEDHWSVLSTIPKLDYRPPAFRRPARRIAVVMQGPILLDNDFTRETCRIYRDSFAGSDVILSTWQTDDPRVCSVLEDIESMGIHVIRSTPPPIAGPDNINYQIMSTRQGIRKALQRGAEHVLKTRTDTRLLAANIPDYLAGLHSAFPVADNCQCRGRLLVLDLSTRLYLPNHPSDILMFGHIDDMRTYWSAPLVTTKVERPKRRTVNDLLAFPIPEVYLGEHYLDAVGYPRSQSIAGWWHALADLFLVVDRASLRFFWPKYGYYNDYRTSADDESRNMALCSFRDWITLHMSNARCPVDLDQLRNDPINATIRVA